MGGTLKPSSLHLPCWGLTSCPNSLLIVPFSGSHQSAAGRCGGNWREHNAFLPSHCPNSPSIRCDLYFPPGGWDGVGRAFPRQAVQPAHLCWCSLTRTAPCSKQGECQPLASMAPCSHHSQPCRGCFRTLSALMWFWNTQAVGEESQVGRRAVTPQW